VASCTGTNVNDRVLYYRKHDSRDSVANSKPSTTRFAVVVFFASLAAVTTATGNARFTPERLTALLTGRSQTIRNFGLSLRTSLRDACGNAPSADGPLYRAWRHSASGSTWWPHLCTPHVSAGLTAEIGVETSWHVTARHAATRESGRDHFPTKKLSTTTNSNNLFRDIPDVLFTELPVLIDGGVKDHVLPASWYFACKPTLSRVGTSITY
jgi:hypothetical protein